MQARNNIVDLRGSEFPGGLDVLSQLHYVFEEKVCVHKQCMFQLTQNYRNSVSSIRSAAHTSDVYSLDAVFRAFTPCSRLYYAAKEPEIAA